MTEIQTEIAALLASSVTSARERDPRTGTSILQANVIWDLGYRTKYLWILTPARMKLSVGVQNTGDNDGMCCLLSNPHFPQFKNRPRTGTAPFLRVKKIPISSPTRKLVSNLDTIGCEADQFTVELNDHCLAWSLLELEENAIDSSCQISEAS